MYVSSRCIAQKASFVQVVVFVVECVVVRLLVCRGNKSIDCRRKIDIKNESTDSRKEQEKKPLVLNRPS